MGANDHTPLTRERLSELFWYDFSSGALVWKPRNGIQWFNTRFAGKAAGTLKVKDGWRFVQICIDSKTYLAHRLIWWLLNGEEPCLIDHVNRDSTDNRIENLRQATRSQNGANSIKKKGVTSKFKGVSFDKQANKFMASICKDRKTINLGRFSREEDAARAYNDAAVRMYGQYAALNGLSPEAR